MSRAIRLHLREFVPPRGCHHVARTTYRAGTPPRMHTHDFAEVFWVEDGPGWHLVNGKRLRLDAGDMILVRPTDTHGFAAARSRSLTLTNVAFAPGHLVALRKRYFPSPRTPWPWRGEKIPARIRLSLQELEKLGGWARSASMVHQRTIDLHAFLIEVLLIASRAPRERPDDDGRPAPPGWLTPALAEFASCKHLPGGVAALAKLSHRSPEHVNRTVRACMGVTAGELVNRLRMDYVTRELRMTDRKIMDIAHDVGLTHVSYFYRLFHEHHGLSPRRFRVREQGLLRGGARHA